MEHFNNELDNMKEEATLTWTACRGGKVEAKGHSVRRSGIKARAHAGWAL